MADKDSEMEETVGAWTPSTNSWDDEIESVETIERDADSGKLSVIVVFNEKPLAKQKVNIELARKKFPQKMLAFYERNLYVQSFFVMSRLTTTPFPLSPSMSERLQCISNLALLVGSELVIELMKGPGFASLASGGL